MISLKLLDFNKYKDSSVEKIETFDKKEAIDINIARMDHLGSLGLDFNGKSIIDVGCGVGHLAQFFVKQRCNVHCIDAREENLIELRKKYSNLKNDLVDIEKDDLTKLGKFDIVFCYGLLYHTENPVTVTDKLCNVCDDMLLLETCVIDHSEPLVKYTEETATFSQALRGLASRPSPSLVISLLKRGGFKHIYIPKYPPQHHDFLFDYTEDLSHIKNGHNIRQIFIATKNNQIINKNLVSIMNE